MNVFGWVWEVSENAPSTNTGNLTEYEF